MSIKLSTCSSSHLWNWECCSLDTLSSEVGLLLLLLLFSNDTVPGQVLPVAVTIFLWWNPSVIRRSGKPDPPKHLDPVSTTVTNENNTVRTNSNNVTVQSKFWWNDERFTMSSLQWVFEKNLRGISAEMSPGCGAGEAPDGVMGSSAGSGEQSSPVSSNLCFFNA